MKTTDSKIAMRQRAEEALKLLLSEVSTIRLKEISYPLPAERSRARFVAHVEVLGRSHALACEAGTSYDPASLRKALDELRRAAAQYSIHAAPLLIAPYLPPEAQAICKECRAGFLDFEGNARIAVGEIFIGKRRLTQRNLEPQFMFSEAVLNQPVLPPVDKALNDSPQRTRRSQSARDSTAAVAALA